MVPEHSEKVGTSSRVDAIITEDLDNLPELMAIICRICGVHQVIVSRRLASIKETVLLHHLLHLLLTIFDHASKTDTMLIDQ